MAVHTSLTSAQCHEPKHITTATTADSGKIITPDANTNGVSELRSIVLADVSDFLTEFESNDQFNWQGWEADQDSLATPTITVTTAYTLITIDGLGSQSRSSHTPKAIRGTRTLWNSSTSKLEPIAAGDSYAIRISFTISATTGSPQYITKVYDIGGTGTGVTIPIITDDVNTNKTTPIEVARTQVIYTYDTAFANGVQFYMKTNTGTATISNRRVDIVRLGSGTNGVVV